MKLPLPANSTTLTGSLLFLTLVSLVQPAAVLAEEIYTEAPIKARFETSEPPRLAAAVPVTLVVEADPKGKLPPGGTEARLELQVRVPIGLRLSGEGWGSVELPEEEKSDPSGPWSLYEWVNPTLAVPSSPGDGRTAEGLILARVPLSLTVVEEGSNWVMTCRARLIRGEKVWETYGILFATVSGETAKFHTTPEFPWLREPNAAAK